MIKQNDQGLNPKIKSYGCNFLAHLAMAGQNWVASEVELLYSQAITQGIIDVNCTLKKPQELLALIASPLRQIGGVSFISGDSWGVNEADPKVIYRIARWRQRRSNHDHFTLWNKNGEIYDPYDAMIATYKLEKLEVVGMQFYG